MRPFKRNANVGRGGGGNGPLLTDHLRDLDLELELLKRKREMIEKQQTLLNQQQSFNSESYNYNQPQSFRTHQPFDDGPQFSGSNHAFSSSSRDFSNSHHDFSLLYNEPQQSHNHYPRQSAKKRLGDYVWSDPPNKRDYGYEPPAKKPFPPPKKFTPNPRAKNVPPSDRPEFTPSKNQGGRKPSQRFREGPQKPRPNDFKPTKVTKHNKPVNANQQTNKHLAPKVPEDAPILHADRVPSQQTVGRLELTLGAIMRTVKDKFGRQPAYAHCFTEPSSTKEMKQIIRERIRQTMFGKPVGNVGQIMRTYRDAYPVYTDQDIVNAIIKKKDAQVTKATAFFMSKGAMSPLQFFKKNYVRLMSVSLNKMFEKLEAVTKEESDLLLKSESGGKDKNVSTDGSAEVADKDITSEPWKEDYAKDVEVPEGNAEIAQETSEETAENKEISVENAENLAVSVEKPKEDSTVKESEEVKAASEVIRQKYECMLDDVVLKRLTIWLPRIKSQIMKVLSRDITFERAKQAIIKETNVRLNMANEPIEPGSEISKLEEAIVNKKPHDLDYHVKIQGRPMLPKKSLMTEFLKEFNPKLVKKIKNVRNLLYVGFDNKNDFDRMVASNGTFVGTDKIIVKISHWVSSSALNASSENTSTPNTSNLSDNDVTITDATKETDELNDTLNNQIEELLTSIRNEEENEHVDDNKEGDAHDANDKQDESDNNKKVAEKQESGIAIKNVAETEQPTEEAEAVDLNEGDEKMENEGVNVNEETPEPNQAKDESKNVENTDKDNVEEVAEATDKDETTGNEVKDKVEETDEAKDKVEELKSKETCRGTPIRASSRLATASAPSSPSSIRTRRASKLLQN